MGNCRCCQSHLNEPTLTTKASIPEALSIDMCNAKLLKLTELALSNHTKSITKIDFTSKSLNPEELAVLEAILHHYRHIDTLLLAETSLSSKTWGDIPITLSAFTNLTMLDLSHNYLGPLGAEKLSYSLEKMTKLEALLLENVGLEGSGMILICGSISNIKTLKMLSVGQNRIGNLGIKMLANVIFFLSSLIFLDIHNNSITSEGSIYIGKCIKHLKQLKILKVGGNQLMKDGGNTVISNLPASLKELWIENSGIEDSNMLLLNSLIGSLCEIDTLSLDYNLISYRGAEAIAELLPRAKIKHLSLIGCEVSSCRKALSFACETTEILL